MPSMFGSTLQSPGGMFGNLRPPNMALVNMGLGLLSGGNKQEQFRLGMQGLNVGMESDRERRKREKDEEAERKRMAALGPALDTLDLPDEVKNYLLADPSQAADFLKPKSSKYMNVDGRVFNETTGEFLPDSGGGGGPFVGKGLDAQALNALVQNGSLTPQQAYEVAAGKTVTGPNGEMLFATPSALTGGGQRGGPNGMTQLTGPKISEEMRKVGGFANRAATSHSILSDPAITGAGQNPASKVASGVPGVGNYLVPENYQKFDQARRDFINAVLRRESGAVISEPEFTNANIQYFPQPGDTPEVLAQKAANREQVIQSLLQSASPVPTFPDQQQGVPLPSGGSLTPNGDGSLNWNPPQ